MFSRCHNFIDFRRLCFVGLIIGTFLHAANAQQSANQESQWQAINDKSGQALAAGDYAQATLFASDALKFARGAFGDKHPITLGSLANFAGLYMAQGRYVEAEPLSLEALRTRREVLGPRHPNTLSSMNNLAILYKDTGRFAEAEPLLREVNQTRLELFGPDNRYTLRSLDDLAGAVEGLGRYAEAEDLDRHALEGMRKVLGSNDRDTLLCISNLGILYRELGRYGEAEALLREALETRIVVLGPAHPDTLASINNLAYLFRAQSRYADAEDLLRAAVSQFRKSLGAQHPDTLTAVSNLASLYREEGRYDLAEPFALEALKGRREVLGSKHPDTLNSLNNLANLYLSSGQFGRAEPLFKEAIAESEQTRGLNHPDTVYLLNNLAALYLREGRYEDAQKIGPDAVRRAIAVFGPQHPETLNGQLNEVSILIGSRHAADAVRLLEEMQPNLLGWIGQELFSTVGSDIRRQLVSSQSTYQDLALTLATSTKTSGANRLAGTAMLRFKLLQGEEEAYLARLVRQSKDQQVRTLADQLNQLRTALAGTVEGAPKAYSEVMLQLEEAQRKLVNASPEYNDHLRVLSASIDDVRVALPKDAVLIELRQYRPLNLAARKLDEPRFAAMLLTPSDEPLVVDVGSVSEIERMITALDDQAAVALYQHMIGPFEQKLAKATAVYVAPDGIIDLLPFSRLKLPSGEYWWKQQEVRVVQTGRDLLRSNPAQPARGLVALGGIDFEAKLEADGMEKTAFFEASGVNRLTAVSRAAGSLREGFGQLPQTAQEVKDVADWYRLLRADEPTEVWSGAQASKARLMKLEHAPRVLHLATHGFYRPNESREPMLLSGVALAGANLELSGKSTDGILFALEAEGLNLEGTELVVLSACDTAQGSIDYSEGIFGLARALRTAGARNVMVTLWKLADGEAREFMVDFYKNWLSQANSDPAKALRDTQLDWMKDGSGHDVRSWAPYLLIE